MVDAKNLGLAAGIFCGVVMFLLTIISVYTGYGAELLNLVATLYPGYTITLVGSIIGLIYGFVDGFVGGYIFIWLYNKLEAK